jgi:glycosyltransferase involved in cell wall biosynthesis
MRVLHMDTEKTWRGGENQIRLLIQGLKASGVESYLATQSGSEIEKRLSGLVRPFFISKGGYHLPSAIYLARWVRDQGIQVIDAHTSATHSLGILVKKLYPQVKLVVHRRVDNPIKKNFLTRRKYLSPSVDQFVGISGAIAQMLGEYGVLEEKISVVKSATEMPRFTPVEKVEAKKKLAQEQGLSPGALFIGNASALDKQKDPFTLLCAFHALRKQNPNQEFCLLLAGDGKLRTELETLVKRLGLEAYVRLLGFRKDVRDILLGIDIVALPSINEGLGTTLLDSVLCGCAVVATNVGGIPEIIIDGETGLLISPQNPVELTQKLNLLAHDQLLRGRLVTKGCQHVEANFSVSSMVAGNLAVYRKILGISGAGS